MKITAATIVAAMIGIPAGLAQDIEPWSAFGQYEPSTPLDTPDFMWQTGPGASSDRIYFNAFTAYPIALRLGSSFNAHSGNVGALHTQNEAYFLEAQEAVFGVWSDCNGDGYIGHAESGLLEYRAELLFDDSICAPVSGTANSWVQGAHNYRGWVTELIPIAGCADVTDCSQSIRDQRVYYDPGAMVWGDYGLPDQAAGGAGGSGDSCAITPVPRGTWATTAGTLNYLDCSWAAIDLLNTPWQDNITVDGGDIVGEHTVPLLGDPLGLRVENEDDATGSAYDVQLFGPDHTDNTAVSVWDCDSAYVVRSGDVLNQTPAGGPLTGEPHNFVIYNVAPGPGDLGNPTVPGTVNHTNEGFDDCDTSNDDGHDFYSLLQEGDVAPDTSTGKTNAVWNFGYVHINRGDAPWNVVGQSPGNAGAPGYMGVYNLGSSGWTSGTATLKLFETPGVRAGLDEVDLSDPNTYTNADPGVEDAAGAWYTYYAYTKVTGRIGPGGQGLYGAAQCGDATSGVVNGWECDVNQWNLNGDGTQPTGWELLAVPGSPYTHRDVDCYDGSNDLGVPTQFGAAGTNGCPRVI